MNVEDFIEALKKHQKCDVENCLKFNCSECEFALSMDKVPADNEILMYFEELKDLRVKLERNSEELEAYKKHLNWLVKIYRQLKGVQLDYAKLIQPFVLNMILATININWQISIYRKRAKKIDRDNKYRSCWLGARYSRNEKSNEQLG